MAGIAEGKKELKKLFDGLMKSAGFKRVAPKLFMKYDAASSMVSGFQWEWLSSGHDYRIHFYIGPLWWIEPWNSEYPSMLPTSLAWTSYELHAPALYFNALPLFTAEENRRAMERLQTATLVPLCRVKDYASCLDFYEALSQNRHWISHAPERWRYALRLMTGDLDGARMAVRAAVRDQEAAMADYIAQEEEEIKRKAYLPQLEKTLLLLSSKAPDISQVEMNLWELKQKCHSFAGLFSFYELSLLKNDRMAGLKIMLRETVNALRKAPPPREETCYANDEKVRDFWLGILRALENGEAERLQRELREKAEAAEGEIKKCCAQGRH